MSRRVVTGHDESGRAIVFYDGPAPIVRRRPSGLLSTLLWATEPPALAPGKADRAEREIGIPPPPEGSIFRVVDFPAGVKGEMHRTQTVDYGIVLDGEIDMVLPDGSEVHLRAGDVLVQQATEHAWENRGGAGCRIAFILVDKR